MWWNRILALPYFYSTWQIKLDINIVKRQIFVIESDFKEWIRVQWNEKLYFYCKRNNEHNTVKEGFEMIFDLCKS